MNNQNTIHNHDSSPPVVKKQRGAVLVIATLAMFSLLLITGLSIDGGHLLLNKTRLQNAVDAAALNAAHTLNALNDTVAADTAARDAFRANAEGNGNSELIEALDNGEIGLTVLFSRNLTPFTPGTTPATFVKVIATNFQFDTMLIRLAGHQKGTASATAIAAASPSLDAEVCDFSPMMFCGSPDDPANPNELFGYPVNSVLAVKHGSGQDSEVGPGNFQLIRMPDGQGGSVVRSALAGDYESVCLAAGEPVETEPGNTVGPVVQGINTRFGQYQGPVNPHDHPADRVIDEPSPTLTLDDAGNVQFTDGSPYSDAVIDFQHSNYKTAYLSAGSDCNSNPTGCHRRIITVPVGDCSTTTNGQGQVPTWGFVCVYLIQAAVQQGNEAHVFAQLIEGGAQDGCTAEGSFSMTPSKGPLPTKIILYKDPDSVDS